jgi:hypothetical protein
VSLLKAASGPGSISQRSRLADETGVFSEPSHGYAISALQELLTVGRNADDRAHEVCSILAELRGYYHSK